MLLLLLLLGFFSFELFLDLFFTVSLAVLVASGSARHLRCLQLAASARCPLLRPRPGHSGIQRPAGSAGTRTLHSFFFFKDFFFDVDHLFKVFTCYNIASVLCFG